MAFSRGNGPLVSILIPTRGRPQGLVESIASCWNNAAEKHLLEFILKVDEDDDATQSAVHQLMAKGLKIGGGVSPRGRGYPDMPLWVDAMCREAKGDWLFLFNDDAKIVTPGWDQHLLHTPTEFIWHGIPDICCLAAHTLGRTQSTEFIFLRRKVFELWGHWSLDPHCDNWAYSTLAMVGSAFMCPINIEHNQGGGNDKTFQESEAQRAVSARDFNSSKAIRTRLADAAKLMDYIDGIVRYVPNSDTA